MDDEDNDDGRGEGLIASAVVKSTVTPLVVIASAPRSENKQD